MVLTASAAELYLWSTGETTQSITVFTTGSYTVTVTDSLGNTDIATAIITEPSPMAVGIDTVTNVLCHGDSSGTASASPEAAAGAPAAETVGRERRSGAARPRPGGGRPG